MDVKASFVIAGIVSILSGIKLYITGWDSMYGFPVPKATGMLIVLFGIIFIAYGILHKGSKKKF